MRRTNGFSTPKFTVPCVIVSWRILRLSEVEGHVSHTLIFNENWRKYENDTFV
jgi:hypothetical protein